MDTKIAGLGALAVGAGALVFASAATLGGITTDTLGADVEVVASCDTDGVTVENWTPGYSATQPGYAIGTFDIDGIASACNGKAFKVTLSGASNASLGETTGTVSGTTQTVSFSSPTVDAEAVEGIAITIYG